MDYIQKIRSQVGNMPLLLPGTAIMVLDTQSRLLLQLRADTGSWGLPGGYIEPGEYPDISARRELLEETGLSADQMNFIGIFSGPEMFIRYPNGDQVYSFTALYSTNSYSGELKLCLESKQLQFFAFNELPDNIVPPHQYILDCIAKNT